jgi:predicted O-methyltransferase YrrM
VIITKEQFASLFGIPPGIPGGSYLTHTELAMLVALACHVRAKTVIEFGIQDGQTALALLDNCTTITKYVGIDLPAGSTPHAASQIKEVPAEPGKLVLSHNEVTIIRQDSRLLRINDLPVADFIWIDGGHDIETVRNDTALALGVVARGGCVAWHDYNLVPEIGVRDVIDSMNKAHGDRCVLIAGTWTVFRFCDFPNPYRPDTLAAST